MHVVNCHEEPEKCEEKMHKVMQVRKLQYTIKNRYSGALYQGLFKTLDLTHSRKSVTYPQDGENYWNILLKLKLESYTIFKYKETEFNDFISIVAAVGGSLGLFLGFSCYQVGTNLIKRYLS